MRVGLLTKLNVLAIGLIVATAIGIVALLVYQQIRDEQQRLRAQGMTIVSMLAERSESAIASGDDASFAHMAKSLADDHDVAYVAVLDSRQKTLWVKAFGDAPLPTRPVARLDPKTVTSAPAGLRGPPLSRVGRADRS